MPRCQRFPWAVFGARPPERTGQQKSKGKTEKNESLIKQDGMNFKDLLAKLSQKVFDNVFEYKIAIL